jgi:glycosyltransferase involved in cell wall biosynthesis
MRILAIEPYYGGSHRSFLDGWRWHSRHAFDLLTMPARKWKWRMRGAAVELADQVRRMEGGWDAVFASDFLDLAAFAGMLPQRAARVPLVAYFHENQLTYPVQVEDERDYQFGFTNLTTCLAADRVLFNSRYNRDSFLAAAQDLLGRMPDEVPEWAPQRVRERSEVIPVGVDFSVIDAARDAPAERTGPLRVLWNHRWEHDKGPEAFFRVLFDLADTGCPFELAVVGEQFRAAPSVFAEARARLADRIVLWGYRESREDYARVLAGCDVVVSTARHEFFGVAVVEAVYAGCFPLLPNRLSYPGLLPEALHGRCLYEDEDALKNALRELCLDPAPAREWDGRAAMARYAWEHVAPMLDDAVESASRAGP